MFSDQGSPLIREVHIRVQENIMQNGHVFLLDAIQKELLVLHRDTLNFYIGTSIRKNRTHNTILQPKAKICILEKA